MFNTNTILAFTLSLALLGCDNTVDSNKKEASKFEITIVTPAIEEALAQFKDQDRRLELNGCEIRYNDKTFGFDSTIKDVVAVFGQYGTYRNGIYMA